MAVLDTYNCSASCSCVKFFPVLSCCSFSLNSMILLLFVPCFHTSINGFFYIFCYFFYLVFYFCFLFFFLFFFHYFIYCFFFFFCFFFYFSFDLFFIYFFFCYCFYSDSIISKL